ncbi:MAG: beta-lactamase family protein, partial [Gemmatimonadota bacterium]|nr:beta-lactamase family protein [Gemmatimonadota bacterium]
MAASIAPARVAGAQATTPAIDSLKLRIRHLIDSAHAPSVAVAVSKGGKIIWEEGFGYADIASHTPATATTLYSMASISKPITATGLMKLVEAGKVDLDRPANDYLGKGKITGLAGDARAATVRRVMSHTAGLPLHYRFFYDGSSERRPSMDEAISRYGIVVYPPGDVYNYSNLGYGIVEEIIAHVSGKPYEEYMRNEVFLPLGMPTTTISTGKGLQHAATRYDGKLEPIAFYDFDHRGASAVYTSAHELVRFGIFHLRDHLADQTRILKDSTIAAMERRYTPGDTITGYGLGWGIDDSNGFRIVSHTGGMPGVSTILFLYPAEDMAIVALTNQSSRIALDVTLEIARAVLPPRYVAMMADTRARERARPRQSFLAPAELMGEWAGTLRTYEGTVPLALQIKSDEVRVRLGEREQWTVLN